MQLTDSHQEYDWNLYNLHPKCVHPKLPKTAIERQEYRGNGTPKVPGVLHNATPSPAYLGASPWHKSIQMSFKSQKNEILLEKHSVL